MGVELVTDAGRIYSAIWNNSFDTYGLEIFLEPITKLLVSIGEPRGSVAVSVSDHPRWAAVIGKELTAAAIYWDEGPFDPTVQRPEAVRPTTSWSSSHPKWPRRRAFPSHAERSRVSRTNQQAHSRRCPTSVNHSPAEARAPSDSAPRATAVARSSKSRRPPEPH